MAKDGNIIKFSFKNYDQQHRMMVENYVRMVEAMFDKSTNDIAQLTAKLKTDGIFAFKDYPQLYSEVQDILQKLAYSVSTCIGLADEKEWLAACKKNDAFIDAIFDTTKLSKERLEQLHDRNLDALKTFQKRKIDGMNLSQRVWKYVDQYKDQIEQGLDVGLGEGRSAAQLARDLKQNLREPDRLFRRVRNKRGNLVLSKNAKAYHPGRGVYRSSVKNAQRLTRSEINMAYRESDQLRWQSMDFIVGYEIHRSTHEPLCKCKLCERLVGTYPKWFKFKGWHPQCMCYVTPILGDDQTFNENELGDLKAALRGTPYQHKAPKNMINDVPDEFKKWVDENIENQEDWASTPYFIKDNFVDGDLSKGLIGEPEPTKLTPLQIAEQRHAARTPEQIAALTKLAQERQDAINGAKQAMADFKGFDESYTNTLTDAYNHAKWDVVRKETAKLEQVKQQIQKAANDIKSLLDGIKDVDINKITQAIKDGKLFDIMQETGKLDAIKNELEALKYLDNPIDAAKQFSLAEAKGVNAAVEKKIDGWAGLSLADKKKKLEFEINYIENPSKYKSGAVQHSTWKVAQDAYKKELASVNEQITVQNLNDMKDTLKGFKTHSQIYHKLIKDFDSAMSAKDYTTAENLINQAIAKKAELQAVTAAQPTKLTAAQIKQILDDVKANQGDFDAQFIADYENAVANKQWKIARALAEKAQEKISPFANSAYTEARKNNAVWDKGDGSLAAKTLRGSASHDWLAATDAERDRIYEYTHHYCNINEPLTNRRYSGSQSKAEFLDRVQKIESYINRASLPEDMWFQRGETGGVRVIDSLLKFAGEKLSFNDFIANPQLLVGKTLQQGGFMSAGSQKGHGFSGELIFNIYAPKGTKATYVEPFSMFGNGDKRRWDGYKTFTSFSSEHETLFQRGTQMRVTKVEVKHGRYYVDVEIIGQDLKDLSYVNDNYIGY